MSPSESDLRAALRDGEGDGPNVDVVIAGARALRARRRSRLLSAAAAVIVVGGASYGLSQIGGDGTKSASSAGGASAAQRQDQTDGTSGAFGAGNGSSVAVACPATPPRYALPGGGSPGQFGSGGPLFRKPVVSVVVCGYTASQATRRVVLTGKDASGLATSLAQAPKAPPARGSCAILASNIRHDVVLIGVGTEGGTAGTVTATFGPGAPCARQITNGTAVRYSWTPPAAIQRFVRSLPSAAATPSSVEHGSPIHT